MAIPKGRKRLEISELLYSAIEAEAKAIGMTTAGYASSLLARGLRHDASAELLSKTERTALQDVGAVYLPLKETEATQTR